jgi:F-type H+-transporting ATPase subunit delta
VEEINLIIKNTHIYADKLVAQRYAKALIDLAIEKNQLEEVKADIDLIRSSITPEFVTVLLSPVISDSKKNAGLSKQFLKIDLLRFLFFFQSCFSKDANGYYARLLMNF